MGGVDGARVDSYVATNGMKHLTKWSGLILLLIASQGVSADEPWQEALERMPLAASTTELNRTNCVPLMLDAFQSNGVVKATLTNANPTLLDAVTALTNQTFIQATFQPPLLLLHTTEDSMDVIATVKNKSTATKLHQRLMPGRVQLEDADWGVVRSTLKGKLNIGLRPFENAMDSWHFYRHDFAACGVTDWEMLETLALAGKTTFTVNWLTTTFQPDRREGVAPKLEIFPVR